MCKVFVACLLAMLSASAQAQTTSVRVQVRANGNPVADAAVTAGTQTGKTNAEGFVVLSIPPGRADIVIVKDGFLPASVAITTEPGPERLVAIELVEQPEIEESITVSATRTGGRLDDQPLRVEVLDREEIEEKMLMTPGDIVMMLNEMGGMRIQATSPSLGAASVRVQGMRGRYTRFLSDGLPLFGEVGGLGLLQIPPMDLGQVEVIKGVASSLYGASAMGGVVNLISRTPAARPTREVLINRSTRGATDAVTFYTTPLGSTWGLTLLGSAHWQEQKDIDGDRWSDLPHYARGVLRPRLFWSDGKGNRFFATAGVTLENREGGTAADVPLPAAGTPYVERLNTNGLDAGVLDQRLLAGTYVLTTRVSLSQKRHTHGFGDVVERDRHRTGFAEVTVRGTAAHQTWVVGAALERAGYDAVDVRRFSYAFTVPGIFAQDDFVVARWLSVSASARLDHHSEYGTFVSPRLSALLRSGGWNGRVSVGTGFFGPSALTEETEAAGLSRLTLRNRLLAEKGRSASVDLTRSAGPLSTTVTLFASRVTDSIKVDRDLVYTIGNAERTTNVGVEALTTLRHAPLSVTGTYTYVRSRELDRGLSADVPLTPRHSAGLVGMWEREDVGRAGVEIYFTGAQQLEANPYATKSEPYVIFGLLAERQFGRLRLFINGENLSGVRQSHWDPLVRPSQAADGRWTVDAWAPLEGRNINGGVRMRF